ncbi:MAG TPA: uracil-DNA glycosylase [Caulobacteraceae bacterium]
MVLERRLAESLLSFWAGAGVDSLYLDEPADRMAEARAVRPAPQGAAMVRDAPAPVNNTGDGRALAWAASDLDALAAAIAEFDGCALKQQGARQAVCWRGAPDAPVMIVGEAPGAEEDAQGAPFVGRAGKLLDKMLAAAGLEGRVLITNTVFWRPPGNRTPSPEEQLACAPFVERAIDIVRPKLLLFVGGAAAKAMLDRDEGILALRGRWFEWQARHTELEIPAMPTLHPAFLLRQPAAKKKAWSDLLTLVERLDRGERPD